jgi:hypothetical protein
MKMRILLVLFALLPLFVQAEVYRWVDESGNVVYSDQPRQGAQKVELPPVTTYSAGPVQQIVATPTAEGNQVSYSLQIVKPSSKETIRENSGDVEVEFVLEPRLRISAGDKIVMRLDDTQNLLKTTVLNNKVTNVDRGTHSLHAWVIGPNGQTLSNEVSVTFYMHQASKLFSKPQGAGLPKPPPAPRPLP